MIEHGGACAGAHEHVEEWKESLDGISPRQSMPETIECFHSDKALIESTPML